MAKSVLKVLLKLVLTALALYLVFRKIDTDSTLRIIRAADGYYLFVALLFFVLSKGFSAFRLNCFFRDLNLFIPSIQNLKLYGIGMFYNLFLPGGIGGDGYKVYLLNKHHKTPVRQLFQAVLLDRINGLAALILLMLILLFWVDIDTILPLNSALTAWLGILSLGIGFYGMMRIFFSRFMGSIAITVFYSILVQCMQLTSAFFILKALGITSQILAYQFVFLLSSIVAVLPLTIGGVGARELVFIFSHEYIGIDKNSAVAFSLLFFIITAFTSLAGAVLKYRKENGNSDTV